MVIQFGFMTTKLIFKHVKQMQLIKTVIHYTELTNEKYI